MFFCQKHIFLLCFVINFDEIFQNNKICKAILPTTKNITNIFPAASVALKHILNVVCF